MEIDNSALGSYLGMFGKSSLYRFSNLDAEPAIKVANLYWENADITQKKTIPKYIRNLFGLWKVEYGLSHEVETNKEKLIKSGAIGFSRLLFPRISEEERLKKIRRLKAWECTPPWIESDPINFLFYLWVNNHWTLSFHDFLVGLSWLIIKYSKDANQRFLAPIIVRGLWLAEIRLSIMEESGNELYKKYKKATKGVNFLISSNLERKEKAKTEYAEICRHASRLLDDGYKKRDIAGIISKGNKNYQKVVSRALHGHETGLWLPKKNRDTRHANPF